MSKLFLPILSLALIFSCKSSRTTAPLKIELNLKANYFEGKSIQFSRPQHYTYHCSDNIVIYPKSDSLEIRAIESGEGHVCFWNNNDTFLNIALHIQDNPLLNEAKRKIATNDPIIYRNDDLANRTQWYIMLNKPAPDFTISNTSGGLIDQRRLKGSISMINFWFYGCTPCMNEMPDLRKAVKHFRKDSQFQFFSFCKDTGYIKNGRPYFSAAVYLTEHGITRKGLQYHSIDLDVTHGINAGKLEPVFQFHGYPTSFITDKSGIIRYVFNGMATSDEIVSAMEFLSHDSR